MASTTWTTEHLEAIEEAIGTGALRVQYNDRTVVYRSQEQLERTREIIRRALGLTKRSSAVLCESSKGTV